MTSPDPVSAPSAYQEHLLTLLGGDDPATVQAATPVAIRALVAAAGHLLRVRPSKGEWSMIECAGHLNDAEVVYSGRYRWILAHDQPPLIGYDQDSWVARLRHQDADPELLLSEFETMRAANLALWRRTPVSEHDRVGIHAERGPEGFAFSFRLLAGHDRFHLDQARRTLDQVRGAQTVASEAGAQNR